jgi:cyclophilin family peptidyl-prolyl cis-trans isomerase
MPSAKRERQRANRELAREQAAQARRSARRKRSATLTSVLVVGLIAAALLLAYLVSRGGDDDTVATDTSTSAGVTTTALNTAATARTVGDPAVDGITCDDDVPTPPAERPSFSDPPAQTIDVTHTYVATLTTSCGAFDITLDAKNAPITTNNFVFLARAGFYDATTFHRVFQDFVMQGGDPSASGTGGPGYEFADENITAPYRQGSVAMANSGANTNGSQFFVCTGTQANCGLEQKYSNFGMVTQGLDVARKIEAFAVGQAPTRTIYLKTVTIKETDASGAVVPEPTTTTTAGATTASAAAGSTTASTSTGATATSAAATSTSAG